MQVKDIALEDYISVKAPKAAVFVPHTAGRYQKRRFRKALCPVVERCVKPNLLHFIQSRLGINGHIRACSKMGECPRASSSHRFQLCFRLTNSIMMHGRNNGKKLMAVGASA